MTSLMEMLWHSELRCGNHKLSTQDLRKDCYPPGGTNSPGISTNLQIMDISSLGGNGSFRGTAIPSELPSLLQLGPPKHHLQISRHFPCQGWQPYP